MDGQLYTYSLVRVLYERGRDYVDAFVPVLLATLPRDGSGIRSNEAQARVLETTGLEIPIHSLETIATRASRQGLLTQESHQLFITDQGRSSGVDPELEREVDRRLAHLADGVAERLHQRLGTPSSREEARGLLLDFVQTHAAFFESFVDPSAKNDDYKAETRLGPEETVLIDYLCEVEEADQESYTALRDLVFGSIVASVMRSDHVAEASRKFERTVVACDTNVLFFALGLHYDEYNKPVQELFQLLKANERFKLVAFESTVAEVIRVLKSYPVQAGQYVDFKHVNTIYSSLRSKGWGRTDLLEFMTEIEGRLAEIGVVVVPVPVERGWHPLPDD
jgi:hypothetical protein